MFNTEKHRTLKRIQDPTVINAYTDKDKGDSQKLKPSHLQTQ